VSTLAKEGVVRVGGLMGSDTAVKSGAAGGTLVGQRTVHWVQGEGINGREWISGIERSP